MTGAMEAPFSDLVNKPRDTVAALLQARGRLVRLRRRDAEDLVLTTAARYEQDHEVVSAATRLAVALTRHGESGRALLLEVLPEVFPWVRFLPADDVRQFLDELVGTLQAVEDLDSAAPVAQLITEWRHTAEVHADPELLAILSQDGDDYGPVPAAATGAARRRGGGAGRRSGRARARSR